MPTPSPDRAALIVGASGIAGSAVTEQLLADGGWTVYGLCRTPGRLDERAIPVIADLRDPHSLTAALADIRPTHVFYTSWARMPTEAENCVVNGAMVHGLAVVGDAAPDVLTQPLLAAVTPSDPNNWHGQSSAVREVVKGGKDLLVSEVARDAEDDDGIGRVLRTLNCSRLSH